MLRLNKVQKHKKIEASEGGRSKTSTAHIRMIKDLGTLHPPSTCKLTFPEDGNVLKSVLTIKPSEGYYCGGVFQFTIDADIEYPYKPPKVRCMNRVYHPNIDYEGAVCLSVLRDEWSPVRSMSDIVFGLNSLFTDCLNPEDALHKEAGMVLLRDARDGTNKFERNVKTSMRGGQVDGRVYDNVLAR